MCKVDGVGDVDVDVDGSFGCPARRRRGRELQRSDMRKNNLCTNKVAS